jgi:DNA oxidative demethylase
MKRVPTKLSEDLFAADVPATEALGTGAMILRRFALGLERQLLDAVQEIIAAAPFRHLVTPGGFTMSVAMTNCGDLGWVSDRAGYRYDPVDPLSGRAWPAMPQVFRDLSRSAAAAAGYEAFQPDACLINRYEPGARLSLHRDHDERDASAPIVSVSLGVPAIFQWGGLRRGDRPRRVPVHSGDVVVWGGESRFVYHGVAALAEDSHPLTGQLRINLTFRKAR